MSDSVENNEKYSKTVIKEMLISAVLYLPISFFVWFYASALLVIPVKYLLQMVLMVWQPELFNAVTQHHYLLSIETLIFPSESFTGQGDKLAVLDVSVNPMLYGYGVAVISGLVLSVPGLKWSKVILQIVLGYFVVVLVQTFGSFWEMIKHLLLEAGPDASQAILATGISPNFMALMYQLSYLIFPAVIPVAYWIVMNNVFIGEITGLDKKQTRNFKQKTVSDKKQTEEDK